VGTARNSARVPVVHRQIRNQSMSAQSWAKLAAIGSAFARHFRFKLATGGAIAAVTIAAAGCTPAITRLAGADPADPAARIAGVGYRSTIAPYTSLRPATPAPWREQNESVAPRPRNEREPQ
jgi:hypothetical protein